MKYLKEDWILWVAPKLKWSEFGAPAQAKRSQESTATFLICYWIRKKSLNRRAFEPGGKDNCNKAPMDNLASFIVWYWDQMEELLGVHLTGNLTTSSMRQDGLRKGLPAGWFRKGFPAWSPEIQHERRDCGTVILNLGHQKVGSVRPVQYFALLFAIVLSADGKYINLI